MKPVWFAFSLVLLMIPGGVFSQVAIRGAYGYVPGFWQADVDVFSPMVYHARMGRSPEWVGDTVSWLCSYLNAVSDTTERVWPIIQAHDDPDPIPPQIFEQVLSEGTTSCADGIMMFSIQSLIDDPGKRRVLGNVYTSWK